MAGTVRRYGGGLLVNIAAAWILHRSVGHSLNVEGAYKHVIADLLGSVGVVVAAILVLAFEWTIADPILSIIIAVTCISFAATSKPWRV